MIIITTYYVKQKLVIKTYCNIKGCMNNDNA